MGLNIINDNLVAANIKSKWQATDTAYTSGSVIDFDTVFTGYTNVGQWSNTNGLITIPEDGYYDCKTVISTFGTNIAGNKFLYLVVDGSTKNVMQSTPIGTTSQSIAGEYHGYFQKGQTINLEIDDSFTLWILPDKTYFSIQRTQDYSAGQPAGFGLASLADYGIVKKTDVFPVGTIQQSLLTEPQFQSEMGSTKWVLMNGQSVAGSKYATITGNSNVPDAAGRFLRMVGGDAGSLGAQQAQATAANGLTASTTGSDGNHTHTWTNSTPSRITGGTDLASGGNFVVGGTDIASSGSHGHTINMGSSDVETRPVNIAVNYFVKIDD